MNESLPSFEVRARAEEVKGNVEIANGHGTGRKFFNRADAIRRSAETQGLMARDFCKSCGASGGMHYGACRGEPAPYEQPGPIKFDGPHSYDLYRQGRLSCDHVFRPWETSSGVAEIDGVLIAQMWFEANCKNCDARVGRKLETIIHE